MQTTTTRRRLGITVATVVMGAAASIAAVPTAATAAEMPCKPRVYYEINSNGVNFRTGPSTAYKSKGLLYKHDWGKKVATSGSWIKLKLGQKSRTGIAKNTTGWVAKKYAYDCVPMQLD
ncbi:SH3 domain-containing protein (plasmid) [Streptomyces sp. NBC_00637]|uniref:SH3 domain-containing protein n=1 Tax=Streptomyces sp. NBC_00637 TaxID=2903667 RepID=UPI002F91BEA8